MTDRRVLIVDDEPTVLSGIERRLGERFPLTTCNSPVEAVEILKQSSEFAVVVTDMRMPELDGLQFIAKANAVSPDLIFIMLTGNQDLATLVEAVNSRRIFRYLTKPCGSDELAAAIDAALSKYGDAETERQMLRATFSGAVDVMSDLLNATHPLIGAIGERVKYLVPLACKLAGWNKSAELEIASRMCLVGFSTLSAPQIQELIDAGKPFNEATDAIIRQGLRNSRQLLARIPRLNNICAVIDNMLGEESQDQSQAQFGQLLGLLFMHTFAARKPDHDPIEVIKQAYPNVPGELIEHVSKAYQQFLSGARDAEMIAVKQLLAGMILADDVLTGDTPVLRRGDVVTDRVREHIWQFTDLPPQINAFVYG